jgi:hypothetical protein
MTQTPELPDEFDELAGRRFLRPAGHPIDIPGGPPDFETTRLSVLHPLLVVECEFFSSNPLRFRGIKTAQLPRTRMDVSGT